MHHEEGIKMNVIIWNTLLEGACIWAILKGHLSWFLIYENIHSFGCCCNGCPGRGIQNFVAIFNPKNNILKLKLEIIGSDLCEVEYMYMKLVVLDFLNDELSICK